MEQSYKLGKLVFKLSGTGIIHQHIAEELEPIRVADPTPHKLEFRFATSLPEFKDYVLYPPVLASPDRFQISKGNFTYQVSNDGNTTLVILKPALKLSLSQKLLPENLVKARDWNFLSPSQTMAKNFMYNIFDYITQVENIKLNQSYIHASSFVKGQRAVAIVAWGGIGKTTSMLKLVTEDGWKFLSDDLGIIDEAGMLYRSPKRLQIYAYNLQGQPLLAEKLLANRSITDKMSWSMMLKRRGVKGVRRRVSAEDMFGKEGVSVQAKLTDAFFIERASIPAFKHQSITAEEIARRASSTILSEIEPFGKIAQAIYSGTGSSVIPTQKEIFDSTYNVLQKSFSTVNPVLIQIPLIASPDDLANYLRELIQ